MAWDRSKNLVMHVDSEIIPERPFLKGLPLPDPTDTFTPVSHEDFDVLVLDAIKDAGITVKSSEYGMSKEDKGGYRHKFFVAHTTADDITGGVGMVIGARNSTDKSFSAGLVFGSRVFICDNQAFSGEYVLRRKHTTHILRDLPNMIAAGMGQYFEERDGQAKLIERLKEHDFFRPGEDPSGMRHINHVAVAAAERGIIPYADIPKVKHEFAEPTKGQIDPTAWGLHNAFTAHLGGKYVPGAAVHRTLRLSGLFRTQFAPDLEAERNARREEREAIARGND